MDEFADGKVQPAGTQYLGLIDSLIDLFKNPDVSDVEVVFISYKLDSKGERIVEDNQHVVEIRPIGIRGIGDQVKQELRKQYELAPLMSLMVLWLNPKVGKEGKLGTMSFKPVPPGKNAPAKGDFDSWEKKAIGFYLQRRSPKKTYTP